MSPPAHSQVVKHEAVPSVTVGVDGNDVPVLPCTRVGLLDQIESEELTQRRVRFTPDLIVRESTVAGAVLAPRTARRHLSAE